MPFSGIFKAGKESGDESVIEGKTAKAYRTRAPAVKRMQTGSYLERRAEVEAELIGRSCHFNNSFWPDPLWPWVVTRPRSSPSHSKRSKLVHPFQKDLGVVSCNFCSGTRLLRKSVDPGGGKIYAVGDGYYYRGFLESYFRGSLLLTLKTPSSLQMLTIKNIF